jgi:hypothetical protein
MGYYYGEFLAGSGLCGNEAFFWLFFHDMHTRNQANVVALLGLKDIPYSARYMIP